MRRLVAGLALGLLLAACSTATPAAQSVAPSAAPSALTQLLLPSATPAASPLPAVAPPHPQLPRGGYRIFPRFLVVAHYGTAGTGALGVLGEGSPAQAAARVVRAAAPFARASGRPVLPAFELISSIAQRAPGAGGTYSTYVSDADAPVTWPPPAR